MKYFIAFLSIFLLPIFNLHSQNNSLMNYTPIELNTITGKIYGTQTLPTNFNGKIPVVLIIAGSGATDRDGNNPMMKNNSLKQMADELAVNGIASVRFDKRGIGESKQAGKTESDLRFDDYIQDANNWINLIRQNKIFSKVIVIGHSEGSLIGMNAAINADGYISLAGAGNSADVLLKSQLGAKGEQFKDLCFPIIDSLRDGKLVENINPNLNILFRASIQPYMISWFKHNPQNDIKQLKFASLIIQGDNDLQVSVNDARLLASSNKRSKLVIIEKMNHVLKIIESGNRSDNSASYNDANMPISSQLIETIVKYIK